MRYYDYTFYIDILDEEADEKQEPLVIDRIFEAGLEALGLNKVYALGETDFKGTLEA